MARTAPARRESTLKVGRRPVKLLIFVSGAVLMFPELAGSRVLAPVFGSSVFVWGASSASFSVR